MPSALDNFRGDREAVFDELVVWLTRTPSFGVHSKKEIELKVLELLYRDRLAEVSVATLAEELARDPNVLLMGEEIGKFEGSYKITAGLLQKFGPKRVVDTPIAEMGFIGLAAGAVFDAATTRCTLFFGNESVNSAHQRAAPIVSVTTIPVCGLSTA